MSVTLKLKLIVSVTLKLKLMMKRDIWQTILIKITCTCEGGNSVSYLKIKINDEQFSISIIIYFKIFKMRFQRVSK